MDSSVNNFISDQRNWNDSHTKNK